MTIQEKIENYISDYTRMKIGRLSLNCPYWSNRLKNGRVTVRGIFNGKGLSSQIKKELTKEVNLCQKKILNKYDLYKLAKRKRLGIDCSGFAFRVLEELVRLGYKNCKIANLEGLYKGGINRTNADMLTAKNFVFPVDKISDYQMGDLIRMLGGRHIAVIIKVTSNQIIYAHSSNKTKVQGVHLGKIKIVDINRPLLEQKWLEKTKTGENIVQKYFDPARGDGVFRLKIFV
uniref:NlpC/P60 domain-containing protein n=1 Tax=candidate division CPR3 bacterium TaxID=2268181 RepID=A0A7C4M345_UNCC3